MVYRLFESWPAALEAAGLDLPAAGAPRRAGGWDSDAVIAAILEWTERFGEPPTAVDWNPALARLRGEERRAELFHRERPHWPTQHTVRYHCGTWNAALAAAQQRTTDQGVKRDTPRAAVAPESAHTPA